MYKKYGSEYEGYNSIVGAGNNGCILHYVDNAKTSVHKGVVLMDLGAEYHKLHSRCYKNYTFKWKIY